MFRTKCHSFQRRRRAYSCSCSVPCGGVRSSKTYGASASDGDVDVDDAISAIPPNAIVAITKVAARAPPRIRIVIRTDRTATIIQATTKPPPTVPAAITRAPVPITMLTTIGAPWSPPVIATAGTNIIPNAPIATDVVSIVTSIVTTTVTTATSMCADTILTAAIVISPSAPLVWGWPLPHGPVLPSASPGGGTVVLVAGGCVDAVVVPTSGNGGVTGGVRDEWAVAATTISIIDVLAPAPALPTTIGSSCVVSSSSTLLINNGHVGEDGEDRHDDDISSLLPMAMAAGDGSISDNRRGRSRSSSGSLGFRCIADCSPSPPTVAGSRAAWHGDDRPTV